jgi:hypothetical protein
VPSASRSAHPLRYRITRSKITQNQSVFCHQAFPRNRVSLSKKVGPTQRTLTKVNHKVTQRTKLIHDLPQTRCVLRCRVKSSCSEPSDMCVYSVLSTDLCFQVRQARRRYTRVLTEALVNQLILRLIKCPDYPQPPKRGTPATVQFTRMTLIHPSCSSHRLEVRCSDRWRVQMLEIRISRVALSRSRGLANRIELHGGCVFE